MTVFIISIAAVVVGALCGYLVARLRTVATETLLKQREPVAGGAVKVTSPMPGTILNVKVSVGQSVKKGDVICVLEAMKMENDIPAPQDGVIASINVQKGASVNAGDVLASLN